MKALRHTQEEPLVTVAGLIGLDTPARNEGLGPRITRKFEACFDWLAGPPMSEQERMNRMLAETRPLRDKNIIMML